MSISIKGAHLLWPGSGRVVPETGPSGNFPTPSDEVVRGEHLPTVQWLGYLGLSLP